MATYATEEDVRLWLQATDNVQVTSDLITAALNAAHGLILDRLADAAFAGDPPIPLVLGEATLAGAFALRALARKQALDQMDFTIGGQRIKNTDRFHYLMQAANEAEEAAWATLAPLLRAVKHVAPLGVTDSVPVLGQE